MITKTHVESSEIIKGPLERTSTLGLVLLAPCPAQLAKAEIWGGGPTWSLFISPEIPALSRFAERSLPNVHCTPMGRSRILGDTVEKMSIRRIGDSANSRGSLYHGQLRDRVTPISDVRGESSLYSFEPVDNVGNLVPMLHDPHMNFPSCSTNGQEKTLGTYEVGMLQA